MYKKNKKVWFYASFFQFIAYFCAILRIIIQDEEESKPIRRYQNDYLKQRGRFTGRVVTGSCSRRF